MNRIADKIMPILGFIIILGLFALGLIVFSYLLIIGAVAGLVLFAIAFIRRKFFSKDYPDAEYTQTEQHIHIERFESTHSGRVIDQEGEK